MEIYIIELFWTASLSIGITFYNQMQIHFLDPSFAWNSETELDSNKGEART